MKIILFLLLSLSVWANIGTIMAMNGEVKVKRLAYSTLIDAHNGMELLRDDELLTQARSRVQIILKDDTIVTIGENSSFGFEDFVLDGNKSEVNMRANRGFFRSVTGKIGKLAPERFKIKTASATIGIRGTDFSGNIVGNKAVLKCYSGAITVAHKPPPPPVPLVDIKNLRETPKQVTEDVKKDEMIVEVIEAGMMISLISQEPQAIETEMPSVSTKKKKKEEEKVIELEEEPEKRNYNRRSIMDIITSESQIQAFEISAEDMLDITQISEDIAPY